MYSSVKYVSVCMNDLIEWANEKQTEGLVNLQQVSWVD